jgi:hypothetical protein
LELHISNKRIAPTGNTHIYLVPKCDSSLIYEKGGRRNKNYEIAHIYPLNPTKDEVSLLLGVEQLNQDVNHPDNLIPLCISCHTKFDNPRTREGYLELLNIKKAFISKSQQQNLWATFHIEEEVFRIIEILYEERSTEEECEIEYDPLEIDRKVNNSMDALTKRKVKNNVSAYFPIIKRKLAEMDVQKARAGELISSQIKTFYLKQLSTTVNQQEIYVNIVKWIEIKTKPKTVEAAEILAAFFIQNCEIFG